MEANRGNERSLDFLDDDPILFGDLVHYAVSRIMPHGRALWRANLFRAMRQFGIIEPSGNDEVWWEADWRLQEFVFDCRHRRALASLR
ncbi:hypothetical protein EJ066_14785 [Mesorhizobium sp. M9A.F.Ca.ET.002.03.1.2]|uniref:hypothetical protein n=1 Tax=Mesorhizobium sp. M9A.F.Ca.ET.002.03.1.2 TaxID=2493668 RepID=UPI000F751AB2|nr:hypothetical protein [Mesorhizobium sp. M9A.F.Ca.ET.002.03.1.2]AZN98329.1 hypothetical protein EJ066_14785 [Mesorhizobium sp. M9A.F.Ca.ET.002.03.1.2]